MKIGVEESKIKVRNQTLALNCYMVVWIGVEEFLYKGNVGFLGEMLSKFSKTHVFVLAITWPSLFQIE